MADEKQGRTWVLRTEIVEKAIAYEETLVEYLKPDQAHYSIETFIAHLKARQALVKAVRAYKEQRDG